jgi:hypothetical protein
VAENGRSQKHVGIRWGIGCEDVWKGKLAILGGWNAGISGVRVDNGENIYRDQRSKFGYRNCRHILPSSDALYCDQEYGVSGDR